MEQDAKSQIPAVDLRMVGGRGYIRGISGIDDRGKTFDRAAKHLKQLAETKGEFSWIIELDLKFGPTTSVLRLLEFLDILNNISRDDALRGKIQIIWKVPASDTSLLSTAKVAKQEIEERNKKSSKGNSNKCGLDLKIVEKR